jgi:hypothetical protein
MLEEKMSASSSNLVQALSANKVVLDEMNRLLNEELENIVKMDANAIEEIGPRKKTLMSRLDSSSGECQKLLHTLAMELQLPQAQTLSEILPRLTGADRNALQQLQKALQELGDQVNNQLTRNRELLENSVEMVNNSLHFFNNLLTKRPTYGQQGALLDGGAGVRLVNKEV